MNDNENDTPAPQEQPDQGGADRRQPEAAGQGPADQDVATEQELRTSLAGIAGMLSTTAAAVDAVQRFLLALSFAKPLVQNVTSATVAHAEAQADAVELATHQLIEACGAANAKLICSLAEELRQQRMRPPAVPAVSVTPSLH